MKGKEGKQLRKGFTTGTAAAAAAKAATLALLSDALPAEVAVTLPRGGELKVRVKSVEVRGCSSTAIVVKDGGDDPDVTNKAEVVAIVEFVQADEIEIAIDGGIGVGRVTRPGLAVDPGKAAINPVPMEMISASVKEAAEASGKTGRFTVVISVPLGEKLAEKTMNGRLGIVGGISILGTTGIVEPLSRDAYKDSIECAIDVAVAAGLAEVVFSTGRSSERVVEESMELPEEGFILTGDHMGFAVKAAAKREEIKKVVVVGQFGKFTKLAAGHLDTHCTRSKVEFDFIAHVLGSAGAKGEIKKRALSANTAREIFFIIKEKGLTAVFDDFARLVKGSVADTLAENRAGGLLQVEAILVGYDGEVVARAR